MVHDNSRRNYKERKFGENYFKQNRKNKEKQTKNQKHLFCYHQASQP